MLRPLSSSSLFAHFPRFAFAPCLRISENTRFAERVRRV